MDYSFIIVNRGNNVNVSQVGYLLCTDFEPMKEDNMKKKILNLLFVICVLIIIVLLLLKWNEERFAKLRLYGVEKIVVTRVFDGNGRFSYIDGFEEVVISDKTEVKKFRKLLFSTDTRGIWFEAGDVLGWEYAFSIKVYYEDGYMEEIICRDNDTMAKRLSYENSYALGDENKVYAYCYDLFFDEVNPAFPDK